MKWNREVIYIWIWTLFNSTTGNGNEYLHRGSLMGVRYSEIKRSGHGIIYAYSPCEWMRKRIAFR